MKRFKVLASLRVTVFLLVVAACGADIPIEIPATPTVTAEPMPTPTASPTKVPVPAFIQENQEYFEEKGFTFENEGDNWRVLDGGNLVMELAADQISLVTQEGETLSYETSAYQTSEVNGGNVKDIMTIKNDQGGVERFYLPDVGYWATSIDRETGLNPNNWINFDHDSDLRTGRLLYSLALVAEDFPDEAVYYPLTHAGGEGGLATLEFSIPFTDRQDVRTSLLKAPFRFVGFYQTEKDGRHYDVGALQILNADGSWGIVFLGFDTHPSRYLDFLTQTFTLQRKPVLLVGFTTSCDGLWEGYQGVCRLLESYEGNPTAGVTSSGVIAEDMEKVLLGGVSVPW